jgi:hypothetical protein
MKRKWILMFVLAGFLSMFMSEIVFAQGKIGIVAVEGQYANADSMKKIVEALGHETEFIKEDILAQPEKLTPYSCIILTYRHSRLFEKEYEALAQYVKKGGTLFLTNLAAYWMITTPDNRDGEHRGIRGGGPVAEVTGVKIMLPYRGRVKGFRVLTRNCYTEGLPDEFGLETKPPYDINDAKSRQRTECVFLESEKATTLVESEAYYEEKDPETGKNVYNMDNTKKAAFLTLNSYGKGKCLWLACRVDSLILSRKEKHILQILDNVLKCSTQNKK